MSGLSPGTAAPSPRTFCPPPKNDKLSAATRELRNNAIRPVENFMTATGGSGNETTSNESECLNNCSGAVR